jgi:hypothetical protein
MWLLKYFGFPVLIIGVGVIYWFVSGYEWAGSVMLVLFGVAMGVMGWVLVPTFDDVGPTAPTDPEWHERSS